MTPSDISRRSLGISKLVELPGPSEAEVIAVVKAAVTPIATTIQHIATIRPATLSGVLSP